MKSSDYMGIPREKIPWFPVIEADKCINCGACLNFCSNNVFEAGELTTVVINPYNCVVGCHSCQKVCDSDAIMFPPQSLLVDWLKELRR